jgi:osmoprotectant transport system ATP-binding protein
MPKVPRVTVPPRLALTGVRKAHGTQIALDGVDLAVSAGSFVALVGASGSGKTTLLKTINRLVVPDAGTIRIDGVDAAGEAAPALRRRIGYVFQHIGLFPHLSVGENIWMVPRLARAPLSGRATRVAELLRMVGLPEDMATRLPPALSGGQAQRVGFARALAARPQIVLMDEPFGALDPITRDELGRAYRALHDAQALTTLMVTHDMAEALLLADRIVVLDAGRIRADGTPAALMAGHEDPLVRHLVDVPRRQAERLAAIGMRT